MGAASAKDTVVVGGCLSSLLSPCSLARQEACCYSVPDKCGGVSGATSSIHARCENRLFRAVFPETASSLASAKARVTGAPEARASL